jgi:hypothetical protein
MRVPLRERSFGELIGLCFSVSAGHFGSLFPLALLLNVPGAVLGSLREGVRGEFESGFVVLLAQLVFLLIAPLFQAATIRLVVGSFTGESSSLMDCLRLAIRRLWPLLGFGMITGLLVTFGLLICLAPGLIFLTWYYLGPPVMVVEKKGVRDAMARSKKMSEGRRGAVFAYLLATNILFQGVCLAVEARLGRVLDPRIVPWLDLPFASLLSMPLVIAPTLYYINVRVAKEGLDLDRLSALVRDIGEGASQGGVPG